MGISWFSLRAVRAFLCVRAGLCVCALHPPLLTQTLLFYDGDAQWLVFMPAAGRCLHASFFFFFFFFLLAAQSGPVPTLSSELSMAVGLAQVSGWSGRWAGGPEEVGAEVDRSAQDDARRLRPRYLLTGR